MGNRTIILIFILLLNITCLLRPVSADSPLTSTPFYKAYLNLEIVKEAKSSGVINKKIFDYLESEKNPIDIKAAVINALGWDINGKSNAGKFMVMLAEKRKIRIDSRSELLSRLRPDEIFCAGYLLAMDNYFKPARALSLLEAAYRRMNKSLAVAIIYAVTAAQNAMDDNWCKVWRLIEDPLNNKSLDPDIKKEAIDIIMDYMKAYRSYCK